MSKILVLGDKGQLGTALTRNILNGNQHQLVSTPFRLDICDLPHLTKEIARIKPNVVINCAAYTDVNKAELDPGPCFAVNARGVHNVASICANLNIEMVQISSDYVFSGSTYAWPYAENSHVGPLQTYGVSKVASEVITRNQALKYKIFRTSALFGETPNKSKGTFIKSVLDRITKHEMVEVYNHHRISVGYAPHIARAIVDALTIPKNGVYHVINDGYTSWYNFALTALKLLPNYESLHPYLKIKAFDEEAARERRPQYSAMKNSILPKLPHFEQALIEYLQINNAKASV